MENTTWVGGLAFVAGVAATLVAVQLWPKLSPSSRVVVSAAVALGVTFAFLTGGGMQTQVQGKLAATSANAAAMCVALADEFQQTSSRWAIASWSIGLVAALLSAIGGLVGRGGENEKRWYRLGAGVLLATLGSSLSATAAYSVARSNAASAAAASATAALTADSPAKQYKLCVTAKAQWLESRTASLDQTPTPQPKAEQAQVEPKNSAKRPAADAGTP